MPLVKWKAGAVGLGLLLIALVAGCPSGCSDNPSSGTGVTAPGAPHGNISSNGAPKTVDGPRPMLHDWAKPAFALVLSGAQNGYMEPCGCSATQSGGLSRRADFFRQIRDKGWAYTALDFGGLVRKDNLENKFKFQVMLSALKDLGYRALAVGKGEVALERLDPGFLLLRMTDLAAGGPTGGAAGGEGETTSLVSSNVELTTFKDAGVPVPTKVVTVGGHKVGVAAILGDDVRAELFGNTADPQIAVKDPKAALTAALASLKKQQPEVLVLLAHSHRNEALALAKEFPQFDLVVTAGPDDGESTPQPVGKTLFVEVGEKGKHVGVVGYYPDDKQQPFHFELVDLDKERFKDTPKMIDRMREFQRLLESNYDAVLQDLPKPRHSSGDRYAGVETCKDCHKKAYAVWKESKHAHAFESLITGREGTKDPVRRDHDPECLSCHTTGWEPQQMYPYESGFYSAAKTPHLKNQQCENCHGPCTKHNELEERWKKDQKSVKKDDLVAERNRIKLTVAQAQKNLCIRCHDYENDPNFSSSNFKEYWDQIAHPGKD